MAQDTRKDPRAKVLTMTVRYKSATVDEFIEQHSHDVSRGGIFIKTPSPFAPGTLLKFEIRIADDKPMLQGVGRVVWKREASSAAGPEKPAGMGVKFIKIDEPSKHLIDKLVTTKGDGGSAYESELPAGEAGATPAVAPAPAAAKPAAATSTPAPAPAGPPVRKATMIGLGAANLAAAAAAAAAASEKAAEPSPSTPAPAPAPSVPPAASAQAADAMFPKTDSVGDMPAPEERTVMRQAAELLQEALKGAGGSMDEIGSTPLVDDSGKKGEIAPTPIGGGLPKADAKPAEKPEPKPEEKPASKAEDKADEAPAAAALAADAAKPEPEVEKPAKKETKAADEKPAPKSAPETKRDTPEARGAVPATAPEKSGGNRAVIYLALVAAAAVAIYFAMAGKPTPEPAPPAVAAPTTPPTPVVTAAPAPTPTASATVAAPATAAPSASVAETAHSAAGTTPAAVSVEKPKPEKPAPPPPAEKPAPPPPAEKPKPKPKPSDDNPY